MALALPTLPKLPAFDKTVPADFFDPGFGDFPSFPTFPIVFPIGGGSGSGLLSTPPCINDPISGINTCGTGGGSGAGGLGIPGLGGVILLPGGGGVGVGTGNPKAPSSPLGTGALGTLAGFGSSAFGSIFGASLLRIAFFLLGLIAIIGAIYLFKDTRPIIQGAVRTVRRGVQTITEAGAAA